MVHIGGIVLAVLGFVVIQAIHGTPSWGLAIVGSIILVAVLEAVRRYVGWPPRKATREEPINPNGDTTREWGS
jgi:hypothetical protein